MNQRSLTIIRNMSGRGRRWVGALCLLMGIAGDLQGQFGRLRRGSREQGGTIALRRRLHVNPLITDPGTFEVEWNNAFNLDGSYSMPMTLKYTPEGTSLLW